MPTTKSRGEFYCQDIPQLQAKCQRHSTSIFTNRMASSRSFGRNVHLYLGTQSEPIGGLRLYPSTLHITVTSFYHFLDILILPTVPVELLDTINGRTFRVVECETNNLLVEDLTLLQPASYLIQPINPYIQLNVNSEPFIDRVLSHSVTGRDDIFRQMLRSRDRGCVISGIINENEDLGIWVGFEATHIWPLHKGQEWMNHRVYRWITDTDPLDPDNAARMNSAQNGMILNSTIHGFFDKYLVAVDPDDGYKIIVFCADVLNIGGRSVSPSAQENGIHGVRKGLLRWHLRQCVFANIRGAGEPVWDYDVGTSGDIVGRLLTEDTGGNKLGEEIASRLALTRYLPV